MIVILDVLKNLPPTFPDVLDSILAKIGIWKAKILGKIFQEILIRFP